MVYSEQKFPDPNWERCNEWTEDMNEWPRERERVQPVSWRADDVIVLITYHIHAHRKWPPSLSPPPNHSKIKNDDADKQRTGHGQLTSKLRTREERGRRFFSAVDKQQKKKKKHPHPTPSTSTLQRGCSLIRGIKAFQEKCVDMIYKS